MEDFFNSDLGFGGGFAARIIGYFQLFLAFLTKKVPLLDCSKISGDLSTLEQGAGFHEFMSQLGDAMSGIGFVYLINHGVDQALIDDMNAKGRDFFSLPAEVKLKYRKPDAVENFNGYSSPEDERVNEIDQGSGADYKECFDFWGQEMLKESSYPKEAPGLKDAITAYREALNPLFRKLLHCFGVYLKLEDPEFFNKRHTAVDDLSIKSHNDVRLNYYMGLDPATEFPENALRLGEHNDWNTLTFLVQDDVGGLEAKRTDGEWVPVPPIEGSIVLNAGLILELWSGGHFPATYHRVRVLKPKANIPRQSIGYFIVPDANSDCIPLVKEKEGWCPAYPKCDQGYTHWDYFRDRIRGSRY